MVKTQYIPDKGDLVWLNFNPQSGHEKMGKKPAIVISPKEYNEKSGLALFCPITCKVKGYPFEVEIKEKKIKGVILSDQIKNLDWKNRNTEFITKIKIEIFEEVKEKLILLIE